jgi:hypothetical protein
MNKEIEKLKKHFSESELLQKIVQRVPVPGFPFIMVYFAVVKDILDPLELTIIFLVFIKILTFLMAVVVWFWSRHQMHGGLLKRAQIKVVIRLLYSLMVFLELIPLASFFPWTTVYVVFVHSYTKGKAKLQNKLADLIQKQQNEQLRSRAGQQAQEQQELADAFMISRQLQAANDNFPPASRKAA